MPRSPKVRRAALGASLLALLAAMPAPARAQGRAGHFDSRGAGGPATEVLVKARGALTAPSGASRRAIARRFLDRLGVTGLSPGEVVEAPGGVTLVRHRREAGGIPVLDGAVKVAIDRAGRVLAVTGTADEDVRPNTTGPRLTAAQAVDRLRRQVGGGAPARGVPARARQVLFPAGGGGARLGWAVAYREDSLHEWAAVVDAVTGEVLHRVNRVKAYTASVVESHHGAPGEGGTPRAVNLTLPGWLPADADVLAGPNVRAFTDLDDDDAPEPEEEVLPAGDPPDFRFPFVNFTPELPDDQCGPTACGWNPSERFSWQANRKNNAVQAFYLNNVFHDHLEAPPIGFDRASGNFEGDDRLVQQTMDGAATAGGLPDAAHRNNANMVTRPDGQSPTMQLYLFAPPASFAYLGDDAATVWHEHAHGLTNRLVTYATGEGALNRHQAAAMGEGWSDWYALDLLQRRALVADDAETPGEVDLGLPSDAVPHTTRTQPIDCPVGAEGPACPGSAATGPGGYTLGDFGRIAGRPQVHADGEIWGQTLWDLRQELVDATGSMEAGSDAAEALVTLGLRLLPPEPSLLDARNTLLAADTALHQGAYHERLWRVFARRGMGFFASTASGSDTAPAEDFSPPPPAGTPEGTISGRITDADTGLPLPGAVVRIGGVVTPGGAAPAATADAAGRYAIAGLPAGTYAKLTVQPPAGYGAVDVARVAVEGGRATARDVAVRRNWALAAAGAAVAATDDGTCGARGLVDGDRLTGWSAANPGTGPAPAATVTLPRAVEVAAIGIDPGATCGHGASAGLRGYRLEVARDGGPFEPYAQGELTSADAGRLVLLAPPPGLGGPVTRVRLTLLSPQRDCAACSGRSWIDVQELEVHGAVPNVLPAGTLRADPAEAAPGQAVLLTAALADPDSAITGYAWDLDGDGSHDRSTAGPTTSATYARPGTYRPSVAARDFRGGSGTAATTVRVTVPAPAPASTPVPEPAPPAAVPAPRLRIAAGGRGRLKVRLTCAQGCTVTGRVTVSRRTARRLRLRGPRLVTLRRSATTRTLVVRLPGRVLRRARAAGVQRLAVRASFSARDAAGRRAAATRTAVIRMR